MIRSFPEACKKLKLNPAKVLPRIAGMPKRHQKAIIAQAKLVIIAEALNEGWKPNWDNTSEWKYYPWFWMDKPGFRFNDSICAGTYAGAGAGSRLCFKTR